MEPPDRKVLDGKSSLPLMGIGNRHSVARNPDSLPLMGIGNEPSTGPYPSWGSRTWSQNRLITPHGDREHLNGTQRLPFTHYPSIGNRQTCQLLRPRLITPHGDREPGPVGRAQRSSPGAHYPSWGSGTSGMIHHHGRVKSSHYPSWGSGTGRKVTS